MKTTEEILNDYMPGMLDVSDGIEEMKVKDAVSAMIEYAKEAIKADRENIIKHITCKDVGDFDLDGEWLEHYRIDKNSVINAPQIELS